MFYRSILIIALLSIFFSSHAQISRLSIFVDCNCDRQFLRQEMPYTDHVRDRALADIYIFISDVRNASGGKTYSISLIGQKDFEDDNRESVFASYPTMTNDDIRRGLLKSIKSELIYYLLKDDYPYQFNIEAPLEDFTLGENTDIAPIEKDKWNNWIFELSARGNYDKETSREKFRVSLGLDSDRVTKKWRVRNNFEFSYYKENVSSNNQTFTSIRERYNGWGSIVYSLNDHWSTGFFGGVNRNTYTNMDVSMFFQPAVEFNIYPYDEVIRREITFAYRIGYTYNNYIETTIFDRLTENVYRQVLDINMRYRQPWGDISNRLTLSSFLNDFSKNRLQLRTYFSVRVFKGLALRVSTGFEWIRDQINLPAGDTSIEDLLLQQRQIATDFELNTSFGVTYTFGSAFNNIINTRL